MRKYNYNKPPYCCGDNNEQVYSKTQIPYLPILGTKSFKEVLQYIYDAIVSEATAAEFYARLLKEAPNKLHRNFIQHAFDDEVEHLQAFTKLYCYYTGKVPQYNITPVCYPNYKAGILMALEDELEAAEFYRDVQLSTNDQLIKDTFYFAMVDELEHATMFSTLYNT
jgi:rubrerythrin